MSEGEARVMTRQFLYVDGVEIEVQATKTESILLGNKFTGG